MSFVDPDDVTEATETLSQAIAEAKAVLNDQAQPAPPRSMSPRTQVPNEVEDLRKALESTRKASQKKLNGMSVQVKKLQAERDIAVQDVAHFRQELDRREIAQQSSKEYEARIVKLQNNEELLSTNVVQLKQQNQQLTNKIKQIEEHQLDLAHDDKLAQCKSQINEMTADAIRKEQMLANKDTLVHQLKQTVAKQSNQICSLEGDVESKNSNVLMLQTELQIAKQNVESKTNSLKDLRDEHNRLQSELIKLQSSADEQEQQHQRSAENTRTIIANLKQDLQSSQQKCGSQRGQINVVTENFRQASASLDAMTSKQSVSQKKLLHAAVIHFQSVSGTNLVNSRLRFFVKWREFARRRSLAKSHSEIQELKSHHQTDVTTLQQHTKRQESQTTTLKEELELQRMEYQRKEVVLRAENQSLHDEVSKLELAVKDYKEETRNLNDRIKKAEESVTEERNNTARQLKQGEEMRRRELQQLESQIHSKNQIEEKLQTELSQIRQEQLANQKQHFEDQRTIASLQRSASASEEKVGCSSEELSIWKERVTELEHQLLEKEKEYKSLETEQRELKRTQQQMSESERRQHQDRERLRPLQLEASVQTDTVEFQSSHENSPSQDEKRQISEQKAQLDILQEHLAQMQQGTRFDDHGLQETVDTLVLRRQDEASQIQRLLDSLQSAHRKEVEQLRSRITVIHSEKNQLQEKVEKAALKGTETKDVNQKLVVTRKNLAATLVGKMTGATQSSIFHVWMHQTKYRRQVAQVRFVATQSMKELEAKHTAVKRIADEALQQNRFLREQRIVNEGIAAQTLKRGSINAGGVDCASQVNDKRISQLEEQNADYAGQLKKMGDLLKVARSHLAELVQQLKDSKAGETALANKIQQSQTELQAKQEEVSKVRKELRRVLTQQEQSPDNSEFDVWLQTTRGQFIHDLGELTRYCESSKSQQPVQVVSSVTDRLHSILHKFLTDAEKHHLGVSPSNHQRSARK